MAFGKLNLEDLDLWDSFNPFDWDKKTYKFDRDVKDMNPYSVINTDKEVIIVHNVLGIRKEDLKLKKKLENHQTYLIIEGKTIDEITKKEYSISSRFLLDDSQLEMSKVKTVMKNGLLYIIFPIKEEREEQSEIEIAIK